MWHDNIIKPAIAYIIKLALKCLSTRGWMSSLDNLTKYKGIPKYLIGKEHIGQWKIWEILSIRFYSNFISMHLLLGLVC